VATNDAVPIAAEAAYVHLDAAPGNEATVFNAELPVDADRTTWARNQNGEECLGEARVVTGVVVTAGALAGAAEEVADVVVGDGGAAIAAEVSM
jgi:hypothetical protein